MTPNFDQILIHCSSIGKLLTEPKSKADKEEGNLSATAKSHLIEVYARELYDFKKELNNKYVNKGWEVEPEAIEELSLQLRYPMEKNEEVFSSEYFVGTPDVITKNMVFDVKSSYDWITFLSNIPSELDPMYVAQVNGYLDLLGYDTGYIAYVLLDTPESIRNKEKFYLLSSMDVISEESPSFVKAWEEKEKNMIFSNHPIEERILLFEVKKDQELLERAKQKVIKARQFLEEFYFTHQHFNTSSLKNILQTIK